MGRDAIIDEVRQARERYAAQFKFDLNAIYRDLKEREQRGEFTTVYRRPRRPAPRSQARSGRGKAAAAN